jgi:geranylgeranyl diphosphate synthase type I
VIVETAPQDLSALDVLGWCHGIVDPALRVAADTLPDLLRHITGYHLGWWDEHGRAGRGCSGKAIRPALVLLAAEAVGGGRAVPASIPAAVAVELVHNFSLLHDDVMDGDLTRRHRPTAWSVFGTTNAILVGDALLGLATRVLADGAEEAAPLRWLSASVVEVCGGQSADIDFDRRESVTVDECLAMARAKTGALMGCACALGALFGGANDQHIAVLREFGCDLGLAFQLVDDLLGIWGDPEVTGKPVYSDLRNHKKSLPIVAALTSGTAAGAELAALYHRDEPLDADTLTLAADLVDRAGARSWAAETAADTLAQAISRLDDAGLAAPRTERLVTLAHLVTGRDH